MSAETLRRAAALMRERAEAASKGPWKRFGMAGVAGSEWEVVDERRVECDCGEPVALLGCATNADAEHIASWHPAVALAVADWLWETANLIEVHAGTECAEPCLHPTCRVIDRALAVARAYLGEAS